MNEKKKILIIGPSPTRSKGGMATVIEEIEKDKKLNEQFDIDVYESYIDGYKFVRFFFSIYAFIKFCLTKRYYDLYHVHVASRGSTFRKGRYIDVIKKWNKKVILHVHGAQYLVFYDEISEKKKKRVVDILKKADMVIALSKSWKDQFDQTFGLTNCVVLENGIDTAQFAEAITPPEKHAHAFAVMGRLGQRKGTYDLLEAMELAVKTIPDMKCYLAGDGEVEKVRALVQKKNLEKNVEVLGWIGNKEKVELLKHVAIVALPSYNEGLPMSLLEGMAAGKAIISTTAGAIPELVKSENGIIIAAGDVDALANALIQCCSDIEMLKKMSAYNIKKIEAEFSMKTMHEKLADYYRQVMIK